MGSRDMTRPWPSSLVTRRERLRWPLDGGLVVYWQELIAASRHGAASGALPSDLEWLSHLELSGYIHRRFATGRTRRRRRTARRVAHGVRRQMIGLIPGAVRR